MFIFLDNDFFKGIISIDEIANIEHYRKTYFRGGKKILDYCAIRLKNGEEIYTRQYDMIEISIKKYLEDK